MMQGRMADENRRPVAAAGKPLPSVRGWKIGCDEQKPAAASRRPRTRMYAASLATKEDPEHPTIEADAAPEVEHHKEASTEDGTVDMDVELCEMTDDTDMDEQHKDSPNDEMVMDIDKADSGNPLAATEYVEELYNFYRKTEGASCVKADYMNSQDDINSKMRAILIDWLIEVHYKFELMDETLFLTVNIIDRFLEKQVVPRKKLQLVGVTAMLLACKYEEVSVPVVEDLVLISDRAYTKGQILEMEKLILNTLHFNMLVPTPYVFMRRFLKAADSDKQLELVSFFMLELCLVEYQMLKYRPSLLAAAAVYTAHCALNRCQHWTRICELHSRYTSDQLLECSKMMVDFHQKAGNDKLTGVHRKYSSFKFGCATKVQPALFLLECRAEQNTSSFQIT
ncbi:hypothetical protein EJB05_38383 [Eragrostis curvula]|uniref:Uncharacterized protein n=1 Tax=Eragrostis curvula TaxID=38414 RepID=A0A5J9TU29_9POAL|nr:hypothetical protein EJB05_38383 [Eragrostis curvula]